MRWYAPLLYPLSFCYDGVTKLRNHMFDIGLKKHTGFDVPCIVVGNLNVGGSGKTPMVEFLIEALSKKHKIAILSRGYGRKTKGFLMINEHLSPSEVGDEPFQMFSKFRQFAKFAVGEKRVLAIPKILEKHPEINLILLDDAFQHRYLKADLNIMLTTFQQPFFNDFVLPLGRLRESRSGAKRADIVVVSKCPVGIKDSSKENYIENIGNYTSAKTIFSQIQYGEPIAVLGNGGKLKPKAVVVSGLANDSLFVEECEKRVHVIEKLSFKDHHEYTLAEIRHLVELVSSQQDCMLLTTEKDAVKLKNTSFRDYLAEIPIFALPIKISMTKLDEQYLLGQISNMIAEKAYHL
ncbi:tetraacyldisaccharide 4'-kinase [Mongoliibacter ruber]|uniref:Tetraacyldisaccharide 4'-kinase n=1 Tax=Mongoliibacter ruber TaxID=1750599 RepID=A0A2T0WP99_9BACT|nr:tetraacyldisaccharide 4'-kinase [Mongoliibacter ruber]PRY88531.1 tetraacyldisaccharide 4'-kinase [Mongoliibacter ruber]